MKNLILMFTFLGLSSVLYAKDYVEAPYTLIGGPDKCSITIHDKGFEAEPDFEPDVGDLESFFADVTVSKVPGTIFHMKTKDGKKYVGYDGNSGYRLIVTGQSPWSLIPLSKGVYHLKDENGKLKSFCGKLVLRK